MPINVYTGLMRSGKSYEVVSEVILEAIANGRRVVTNVDGISNDLIRAYVAEKRGIDPGKLGTVIHVTNADVFKPDFFPYYDDAKSAHTDTIVQPGDLVCIDEAWRFWPASGSKIHKHHQSFFLEHGHFTNGETGVACDLVLMIQDMSTLNRFLKIVVAFNFRTHKKVSLGLGDTYSISMFEGHKQTRQTQIGNWVRNYKKEIFPLYSSFKGGADGKMVNVDARQNIFANKRLWIGAAVVIIGGAYSFYNVWHFFHPADTKPKLEQVAKASGGSLIAPVSTGGQTGSNKLLATPFSEIWRIAGSYTANGKIYVIVTNGAGSIRVESPSVFQNNGYGQIGEIDGTRVTVWSGAIPSRSNPAAAAPAGVAPAVQIPASVAIGTR